MRNYRSNLGRSLEWWARALGMFLFVGIFLAQFQFSIFRWGHLWTAFKDDGVGIEWWTDAHFPAQYQVTKTSFAWFSPLAHSRPWLKLESPNVYINIPWWCICISWVFHLICFRLFVSPPIRNKGFPVSQPCKETPK